MFYKLGDVFVSTVFMHAGYRFFFYSNEGDPREPCHIHVRKGKSLAKFWLFPELIYSSSGERGLCRARACKLL